MIAVACAPISAPGVQDEGAVWGSVEIIGWWQGAPAVVVVDASPNVPGSAPLLTGTRGPFA